MSKQFVPNARDQKGLLSTLIPVYGMAKEIGNMNEGPVDEYGAPISGQYTNPNHTSLLDMVKKQKGSAMSGSGEDLASLFKSFFI